MDREQDRYTATVAIVGAGPVGLALGLCLARRGIDSIIVERREGLNNHPKAHYINNRSTELFRYWGVFDEIIDKSYPLQHLPFDMLVAIGGLTQEERRLLSPGTVTSCAQDLVEASLHGAVVTTGLCTIRYSRTFTGFVDHGDHVELSVDGPDQTETITARWLAAADGANSPVRRQLGVEMVGDHDLGSLINVYFHGRLFPPDEQPTLAMQSKSPEAAGAFISMDGDSRYCFHHPYNPADESPDDYPPERCAAMIRTAAQVSDDTPIEVRSIRPWTMTALVAERMRVGSVFLAGDAAHAFPPTGGFGMNSGIQDAYNLAWKLAAVANGVGGEVLLDSYEAERQPIAFLNTAQSLRNADRSTGQSNESTQAGLINRRATPSVTSLMEAAETPEERGKWQMLEHVAAIGQDLGFTYVDSPVVVADDAPLPKVHIALYHPHASPGARAPHLDVRHGSTVISILDLYDGRFTLVTAPEATGWRMAAELLDPATTGSIDLAVIRVGPGTDYEPVDQDALALYGITATGAVLVRPDGHVAFRANDGTSATTAALSHALDVALGRS